MCPQMSSLSRKRNGNSFNQDRKFKGRKAYFAEKNEFSFGHTEFEVPAEHSYGNIYHSDLFSLVYLILRNNSNRHFYTNNSKSSSRA